jgi:hypothetical protein
MRPIVIRLPIAAAAFSLWHRQRPAVIREHCERGFGADAWIKNIGNRQYLAYGVNQDDPDTNCIGFRLRAGR